MSEVNTTENPEELVRTITRTVTRAEVIPTPVDPTLSNEGEAADAKATGDAIAGVIGNLRVNTKAPVSNAITIYAGDIAMSDETGAQTVAQAVESAGNKTAAEIMYDSTNLVSVKSAIDDINTALDSELSEEQIDAIFDEVFEEEE